MIYEKTDQERVPRGEPTPAEIARECERIRAGWSEAELYRRAGFRRQPRVTVTETRTLFETFQEDSDA